MTRKLNKIAVIGATGKAGTYLVENLLRNGYQIRALARNPDKLTQSGPRLESVTGNARNYDDIHTLITGCDAVISTLGPDRDEPDTCSIATGHIIRAMGIMQIDRYLEVAGLAIDTPEDKKGFQTRLIVNVMRRFFPTIINDRQTGYTLLAASNLNWTIVRCPMISATGSNGRVKTSLTDSPGRKISAADLAQFLTDQLTDTTFHRKAPFIANG